MKLKKRILIFVATILLLMLGICTYILFTIKSVHSQIIDVQIDRFPEKFVSFDESYCKCVIVAEDIQDSVHYANVIIYDNIDVKMTKEKWDE